MAEPRSGSSSPLSASHGDTGKQRSIAQPRLFEPDLVRPVERAAGPSIKVPDSRTKELHSSRSSESPSYHGENQNERGGHSYPTHPSHGGCAKELSGGEDNQYEDDDEVIILENSSVTGKQVLFLGHF